MEGDDTNEGWDYEDGWMEGARTKQGRGYEDGWMV